MIPTLLRPARPVALLCLLLVLSGCSLLTAGVQPGPKSSTPSAASPTPSEKPVRVRTPEPTPISVDGVPIPQYWRPRATAATTGPGITPYAELGTPRDFASAVNRAPGTQVALAAGTYTFDDFHPADGTIDGAVLRPQVLGLRGSGPAGTVLEMTPNTSTHAADIPFTFPDTNQLSLMRVTGAGAALSGFTLKATAQGHLYNGLRIDRVTGLRLADVRVVGVPGDASSPPGETFGVNDYRTEHASYRRLEVDGAGVGASGFGSNISHDVSLEDCYFHDNPSSMGATFWEVRTVTITDCIATRNGSAGFNFERVSGSVRLDRPVTAGNRFDIRIASDQGSARYTIVDPIFAGPKLIIRVPPSYYGHPERQKLGDVRVFVHGEDRTKDLVTYLTQ